MGQPAVISNDARASRSRAFWNGVRDQLPILLGVVPFGMIFGALAVASGLTALEAQAFSLILFAGSAQFIAVGMLAENSAVLIMLGTVLIVNVRHLLYSASVAPYLDHLPARWKIALSWLLTDEAFATTASRLLREGSAGLHWYLLGTGLTLWLSWQVSTALGALVGGGIPAGIPLEFALPLTFIALLVPVLKGRPNIAASVVAAAVAAALWRAPYRLGLMAGILAGVAAGMVFSIGDELEDANIQS